METPVYEIYFLCKKSHRRHEYWAKGIYNKNNTTHFYYKMVLNFEEGHAFDQRKKKIIAK
jgi:protein involved in sex pheromone biosynthesis